jgi:hypothetical protein
MRNARPSTAAAASCTMHASPRKVESLEPTQFLLGHRSVENTPSEVAFRYFSSTQVGPRTGKLPRIPFSRRFRSELVATMPAVHAPKLKPTIAPRRMRPFPFRRRSRIKGSLATDERPVASPTPRSACGRPRPLEPKAMRAHLCLNTGTPAGHRVETTLFSYFAW